MSSLDNAAWSALGQSPPPPHVCASCGRGCAACRDGEPCGRAEWCSWCESAYAENPPDADGRVYCAGCGAPFPRLADLISAGLSRYPRRCRSCREQHRADAAADREHYGESPPPTEHSDPEEKSGTRPSVSGRPTQKSEKDSTRNAQRSESGASAKRRPTVSEEVEAAQRNRANPTDPDTVYLRGGFLPRRERSEPSEMATGALPPDAGTSAVRAIAFGDRG